MPWDPESADSLASEPGDLAPAGSGSVGDVETHSAPAEELSDEVIAIAETGGTALITRPETEASALAATDEPELDSENAVADIDGEGVTETVTKDPRRWSRPGSRAIATLLATAAILAALITTRASMLSGQASDDWQTSLRNEVKRSAAVQEDVRYLYQNLLPVAMLIETARAQEEAVKQQLAAHPEAAARLNLEIATLEQVQQALSGASPLTSSADIALPSGGWDLGKALAQQRNTAPDLVALNPDADTTAGDTAAAKARRVSLATVPIALGVLLAALAEPFVSWRRRLLWVAAVLVASGAVAWIVMEQMT